MSICRECELAREVWSDELRGEGYIGCRLLVDRDLHTEEETRRFVVENVLDGEIATGWVNLSRRIGWESGGPVVTNFQLITRGTTRCNFFENRKK